MLLNALQHDKIFDLSKFKAFAEDKINVNKMIGFVPAGNRKMFWFTENMMITSIFSFTYCFQKAFVKKAKLCVKGLIKVFLQNSLISLQKTIFENNQHWNKLFQRKQEWYFFISISWSLWYFWHFEYLQKRCFLENTNTWHQNCPPFFSKNCNFDISPWQMTLTLVPKSKVKVLPIGIKIWKLYQLLFKTYGWS